MKEQKDYACAADGVEHDSERKQIHHFFFLVAPAGKKNQILQSDWFRKRTQFSDLACGQRNEPDSVFVTSKVSAF